MVHATDRPSPDVRLRLGSLWRDRRVVKVLIQYQGLRGALLRPWFARADLFMMKKQLRTLKVLAEQAP